MIPEKKFIEIVELTHLVSIDLLVFDHKKRLLLGKRLNNPAKGLWFVPGGRVDKDKPLQQGIQKVAENELGITLELSKVKKLGIYEHHYENNFMNDKFSTHYVVLPCQYNLDENEAKRVEASMKNQHSQMTWMTIQELLAHSEVHKYTKYYFDEKANNCFFGQVPGVSH